eukprot:gene15024-biopygen4628
MLIHKLIRKLSTKSLHRPTGGLGGKELLANCLFRFEGLVGLGICESLAVSRESKPPRGEGSWLPCKVNTNSQVKLAEEGANVDKASGIGGEILDDMTVPASLFEASGLPRKANKPVLAEAVAKTGNSSGTSPAEPFQYVLDGGSLLQRFAWKRGDRFASILDSYLCYVTKRYRKAVVIFDGYESGPSPKDTTHRRRTGLSAGVKVIFKEDVVLTIK